MDKRLRRRYSASLVTNLALGKAKTNCSGSRTSGRGAFESACNRTLCHLSPRMGERAWVAAPAMTSKTRPEKRVRLRLFAWCVFVPQNTDNPRAHQNRSVKTWYREEPACS